MSCKSRRRSGVQIQPSISARLRSIGGIASPARFGSRLVDGDRCVSVSPRLLVSVCPRPRVSASPCPRLSVSKTGQLPRQVYTPLTLRCGDPSTRRLVSQSLHRRSRRKRSNQCIECIRVSRIAIGHLKPGKLLPQPPQDLSAHAIAIRIDKFVSPAIQSPTLQTCRWTQLSKILKVRRQSEAAKADLPTTRGSYTYRKRCRASLATALQRRLVASLPSFTNSEPDFTYVFILNLVPSG